jgi:putative phage tail component, N-terminal domain
MYTLIVENEKGEQLELTHNKSYDVIKIEGLNPPPAAINNTEISGVDGAKFNSSKVGTRNLVIYLNIKSPVEENRQDLYNYFHVKRRVKIYFKNQNRDVYIEGYVETFENDLFENLQQPQISIICPEPFWKAVDDLLVEFSDEISLFEFPFAIEEEGIEFSQINLETSKVINNGNVETGIIVELFTTTSQVLNPIIYNRTTQTYFKINYDMHVGDLIRINTNQGQKSVTLTRNHVTTNVIGNRESGSSWIQLVPGPNEIAYNADVGVENLMVNLILIRKYEGV